MEMLHRNAGPVAKLVLFLSVICGTSCTVGRIYFGSYYSTGQQKLTIAADSTFTYAAPGLMGTQQVLQGTWTRKDNLLLLHGQKTDTARLKPTVTIQATTATTHELLLTSEIGVNVVVEVLVDSLKAGALSRSDSSLVYQGNLHQLVLKAYPTGMYASLFQNDTLYAEAIGFSGYSSPVRATVHVGVSLRDFYKIPVEDSSLKIKRNGEMYWKKKDALFYWIETDR
ncbi:hypothetical protein [Botryobacter ruber]|uniref:hypothetical protein n=1 Tax=Botryobacter ruber TaxID=2171629 RepID=UPI000FEC8B4E|nr:hypothetical protein [Botryobacter ruber]